MAKPTPDVRALLQEGPFGPARDGTLLPADPVASTLQPLNLRQR